MQLHESQDRRLNKMITARTLILGSAAGLMALSGAQAADLPVKAKAVEYVRICSLYGAGFFYIPGTDTCIKFGGFTFGKSSSAYSSPWNGFPGNINSSLLGGNNTDTGVNNIQYTAQFGNGVSASIGLDDPTVWDRTALYNLSTGLNAVGVTGNAYGGVQAPDIVGNIRIDQAWGLFQISAAGHLVDGSYNTLTASTAAPTALSEISGHPEDKWGGSVMAALNIKNIPTGPGDDIKIDATWAKGDTKNVIATSGTSPSFAMFGSSGIAYQSIGFGATTDGVYLPGAGGTGGIKLTEAYGVRGAFNHNWDPYWSSSLFGSYSAVRYNGAVGDLTTAKGAFCAAYVANNAGAKSPDFSCNPDFNVSQLGVVTRWTPVKNLTFSAEVQWFHLDQKFAGTSVLGGAAPKPTTVYQFKDQDAVSLQVRAQRNF